MKDRRYKTFIQRLGALLVDGIVFGALFFFLDFIIEVDSWYFFVQLTGIVYRVICHWQFGQTIGKWALSIKVAEAGNESNNPAFNHAALRETPSFLLVVLEFLSAYSNWLEVTYFILSFAWLIAELVSIWRNKQQRSLHDLLAKTVVIDVKQYSEWEKKYYYGDESQ
jgi:uncharacterized RDD family membrane protein YckC